MSGAGIFGSIFFGSVGMAAFVYGKNAASVRAIIIGILLMAYPYFLPETWEIYAVGTLLTAGLFMFRE
jgi:hypothetical protein